MQTPRKQPYDTETDEIDHHAVEGLKPPRSPYKAGPNAWKASADKNNAPKDSYRVHPNKLFQNPAAPGNSDSIDSKGFDSTHNSQNGGRKGSQNGNNKRVSPLMRTFDGKVSHPKNQNPAAMPVSIPTQKLVDSQDNMNRMKQNSFQNGGNANARAQSAPRNPLSQQYGYKNENPEENTQTFNEAQNGYLHPARNFQQEEARQATQNNQNFNQQFSHDANAAGSPAFPAHQQQTQQAPAVPSPFPNTYKTQLNDVNPKPQSQPFQTQGLWTAVNKKLKLIRSRSHDSQRHIHRWPSFEPPVYILPGELMSNYLLRIKMLKGELVDENGVSIPPEDLPDFEETEQSIRTLPNNFGPNRQTGNTLDFPDYRPSDRDSKALSATVGGLDFPSMMTSIPVVPNEDEPSGIGQSQSSRPTWQQESFAPASFPGNLNPQQNGMRANPAPFPNHQIPSQNTQQPSQNELWVKRNEDPLRMTPKFNQPPAPMPPTTNQGSHMNLKPKSDEEDTNMQPPQHPSQKMSPNPALPPSNPGAVQRLEYAPTSMGPSPPVLIMSAGQNSSSPMNTDTKQYSDSGNVKIVSLPRSRSASDFTKTGNPSPQQYLTPTFTPQIQRLADNSPSRFVPEPKLSFMPATVNQPSKEVQQPPMQQGNTVTRMVINPSAPSAGTPPVVIQSRGASPSSSPIPVQTQTPTSQTIRIQLPAPAAPQPQASTQPQLQPQTHSVVIRSPSPSPIPLSLPSPQTTLPPSLPVVISPNTTTQTLNNNTEGLKHNHDILVKDNAALQRKILDVANKADAEKTELIARVDGLQQQNAIIHQQFMKLKSLEPEFLRLQKAEQELKGVLANLQGRLFEAEGMNKRMETDFVQRRTALESDLGKSRDEIRALQSMLAAKDSDINRLRALETDTSKLRTLEAELARLRSFEKEALELRPLRSEIIRLRVIESDYWRLKGVESEVNRLKGVESALESTRIRLSIAESELTRIQMLENERLKMLSMPLSPIPPMPTQSLPDSTSGIQPQLNTSAILSEMHISLKEELSALGSLSTLILAKLNEVSSKPVVEGAKAIPASSELTPVATENNALSQKILDTQRDIESRLKQIEDAVTNLGGQEGRNSEGLKFDEAMRARLRIEKSLDGLTGNDLEDIRLSNPELFAKLQEQLTSGPSRQAVTTANMETQIDFNPLSGELDKLRTEINRLVMEKRRSEENYQRLESDFDELRRNYDEKNENANLLQKTVAGLQSKLKQMVSPKTEAGMLESNSGGAQTPALGIYNSGKGSDSNGVSDENKINDLIKYFSQVESERGLKPTGMQVTPSQNEDHSSGISPGKHGTPQAAPGAFSLTLPETAPRGAHTQYEKQTPRTEATVDTQRTNQSPDNTGENVFVGHRRVQGSINPMLVGKNNRGENGEAKEQRKGGFEDLEEGASPAFGSRGEGATVDRASFGFGFKGGSEPQQGQTNLEVREFPGMNFKGTPTHSDDTYQQQLMSAHSGEDAGIQVVLADNLREMVLPRFGIESNRRASEDLRKEDPSNQTQQQNKPISYPKFPRHSADTVPNAATLLKLVADKDREIDEARTELQKLRELLHESEEKRQLEREALIEEETNQALRQSIKEIVEDLKNGPPGHGVAGANTPQHGKSATATPPPEPTFFQAQHQKRDSITSSASSSILKDLDELPVSALRDRVGRLKREREELSRKHKQLQEVHLRSKSALLSRIGLIAESSMKFYETLKTANSAISD